MKSWNELKHLSPKRLYSISQNCYYEIIECDPYEPFLTVRRLNSNSSFGLQVKKDSFMWHYSFKDWIKENLK